VEDKEARMALHAQRADFMAAMAGVLPDIKLDFPQSFEKWDTFFKALSPMNPLPNWPEESSNSLQAFLAGRRVTAQYFQIRSGEERLTRYRYIAPFDGTFSQITVEEGSIVNANTTLGRMISTAGFEVSMPVPRMSIPLVREGMRVKLYSEDSIVKWSGSVRRISSFVDAATQSVTVFVEVPGGNEAVMDGMYLKTMLQTGKSVPLMPITRKALLPGEQVWIVTEDSLLQKQSIDIVMADEQVIYFKGLTPGSKVVAESLIGAMPYQKVNPALR
jgi:RND family efflux transporter MFP subunit